MPALERQNSRIRVVLPTPLVSRFGSVFTPGGAGDDLVGGLGPDEGVAAVVPAVDEVADRGDEVFD